MSENAYINVVPGLGVNLVKTLAIFTLSIKIVILMYNKDLINDSYYFRVIKFFLKLRGV